MQKNGEVTFFFVAVQHSSVPATQLAGAHTAPLGDKNLGHSSLDGSGQTRCAPRFVRLTLLVLTGEENAMSSAEDDSLLPATRYGSVMSTPKH